MQPGGVGPFGGLDRLRLRLRLGNRNRNRNCNSNSNSNSNSQNTDHTDDTVTTRICSVWATGRRDAPPEALF